MKEDLSSINQFMNEFSREAVVAFQDTADHIPTFWIHPDSLLKVLTGLKQKPEYPYEMLFDLYGIDERKRNHRSGQPASDFTLVYQLTSFQANSDIRLKVALSGDSPTLPSITGLWPSANWYEREAYDMFGIRFTGHPHLERILMPRSWKGYPLRKEHPARATELEPFVLEDQMREIADEEYRFKPEEWGLPTHHAESDYMFLNLGPQHPGTHGLLRLILQLDGEDIVNIVPDIGFHHRGAEKMGERQSWHTYIPYTDRIDYLGGVLNNLAYLLPLEMLAGIDVPDRAKVIRVMLSELFRIESHLVWLGTFAQDLGQMSPVFFTFNDRERAFDIVSAITGGRMHPSWFRIGGVGSDLPDGWDRMMQDFVNYLPKRLREYDRMILRNSIFKARTIGIGVYTTPEAVEWGVTGPGLRATGFAFDYRRQRPYSGYDQFEFDIPVGKNGDCFDRAQVRMEEIRQSLRILQQCIDHMPPGGYKADHPLAVPPRKERTMHDIETLITHFLAVSWGPVIPAGEASIPVEGAKGANAYSLISDGGTSAYRVRIRTPSFPHMQMIPLISRGYTIPDLLSILGAMDFVLADLDR
jgi:NADH-quinone oxidoreductase subunit C/D